METYSNLFVTAMGVGTVFFALASLVILTKIMSAVLGKEKPAPAVAPPQAPIPVAVPAAPVAAPVAKDPALTAAISAVLAEELGTDVAALRIHSIKRI